MHFRLSEHNIVVSTSDSVRVGEPHLSRKHMLLLAAGGLATVGGVDLLNYPDPTFAKKKKKAGAGTAASSVQDQVATAVNAIIKQTGTPGVAVGIVLKGVATFYFFGEARTDTKAPITPGTVFGLGSVTKTVTSTLLAYQTIARPSAFSLNDPVTRHLSSVVGQKGRDIKKVTLAELASHTASFPHASGITGATLFMDQPPAADLIAFWESFKAPTNDAPGTQYLYSDLGFITLGYAVAGNAYNSLLASTLTRPLGMTQFGSASMIPAGAAYAQGHLDQHGQTIAVNSLNTDLMASPTDFMTYLKAHMGLLQVPATLSKALQLTQQKIFTTPTSTNINLGLSWQLAKVAPFIIDKDGATSKGGCQSYIGFIPGSQNGVVVLMNKFFTNEYPGSSVVALGRQILGILATA